MHPSRPACRGGAWVLVLGGTGSAEERAMIAAVRAAGLGIAIDAGAPNVEAAVTDAMQDLLARPPRVPNTDRGEEVVARRLIAIAQERRGAVR